MDYPTSDAGARLHNGKFTDGDPVNNIPPSKDSATYQNMVFDELINVIEAGGLTPDSTKADQLTSAINALTTAAFTQVRSPVCGVVFMAGTNISIKSSFGVSSVSRISTGRYRISFTDSMPSLNYASVTSGGNLNNLMNPYDVAPASTDYFDVSVAENNGVPTDQACLYTVMIYGDF